MERKYFWLILSLFVCGCASSSTFQVKLEKAQETNCIVFGYLDAAELSVREEADSERSEIFKISPAGGLVPLLTKLSSPARLTLSDKQTGRVFEKVTRMGYHDPFIFSIPPGAYILTVDMGEYYLDNYGYIKVVSKPLPFEAAGKAYYIGDLQVAVVVSGETGKSILEDNGGYSQAKKEFLLKNDNFTREILYTPIGDSVLTIKVPSGEDAFQGGVKFAIEGKFEEAREEFKKVPFLSDLNESAKRSLEIIEAVTTQKIKKETAVYLFKSTSYAMKKMVDESINELTKAINNDPDYAELYLDRGTAYTAKGQFKQAISDYTKAIEVDHNWVEAYTSRGTAYLSEGLYKEAISDFTKAIEINPKDANLYNTRGVIYMMKLGDKKNACSDFKQGCELGECRNYNIAKKDGDCQ